MDVEDLAFWMFQYAFCAASTTIVAGTLAERCQMTAYLCYSLLLAGFVYPVIAHSVWSPHGFLSYRKENPLFGIGVVDFAGSSVVHMTGGTTALFATMILGPRRGRFHDEQGRRLDKPKDFPGHSMALQVCTGSDSLPVIFRFYQCRLTCWCSSASRLRRCLEPSRCGSAGTALMVEAPLLPIQRTKVS